MRWQVRTNPSMFGTMLKNCQFALADARGRAVMLLQEEFKLFLYEYSIYRIVPGLQPVLIARITRRWSWGSTGDYGVRVFNPPGLGVTCSGRWPAQFTLHSQGRRAADVNKKMFTLSDKYKVTVQPGHDLLLFLSLACCIDRIHHEVEEKRNNNR